MKKVIYVSGPYRSDYGMSGVLENIYAAWVFARELWCKGWVSVCPHLNTIFMDSKDITHDVFIEGDLELVDRSDAIFMLPGWEESEGAQKEYSRAVENGMPVYTSLEVVPDVKV